MAKRRGLANGFIMSGQGMGIFIWPPLMEYLIETYGVRGALLLEAALVLHVIIIIIIIYYADKNANKLKSIADKDVTMVNGDYNAEVGEGASDDEINKNHDPIPSLNTQESLCTKWRAKFCTLL